jgi:uncharacterized protein (DUF2062 family)
MHAMFTSIGAKVAEWLRQGISPRKLALTLALGFAIGCIPVIGIPTVLCAALTLALRLNLPAIQMANYVAMPFQLLLIVPFVRLGEYLFAGSRHYPAAMGPLHLAPFAAIAHFGALALHALVAWLLVAGPGVALMTAALTVVLQQVPFVAKRETVS